MEHAEQRAGRGDVFEKVERAQDQQPECAEALACSKHTFAIGQDVKSSEQGVADEVPVVASRYADIMPIVMRQA